MNGSKLDNRRVAAALIDLAIVAAGGAAILALAGVLGKGPSEIGLPLVAVIVAWALYYYFACESGGGQTVGKRLMRLRVVRTDGEPAEMREVAIRTVLRLIDMQFACLVGLIVMMATGERRGRLGDLAADTMVVSTDVPAALTPAPAAPVSRVPIAESGPAFAPVPEVEAEPEPEHDVASPALKELAADVEAAKEARPEEPEPVVEVEPEPVVEVDPAPEPVVEVDPAPEPVVEVDPAPEPVVEVKPIETVSAMDLVMADDEDAAHEDVADDEEDPTDAERLAREREDASQPR